LYKKKYNDLKIQYGGTVTRDIIINKILPPESEHLDLLRSLLGLIFDIIQIQIQINPMYKDIKIIPENENDEISNRTERLNLFVEEPMQFTQRNIYLSKDSTLSLIKPTEFKNNLQIEELIKETYINLYIINKHINAHENNNLIYTKCILFQKYNIDKLYISLIQENVHKYQNLFDLLLAAQLNLNSFINHLITIFTQLSLLEKPPHELIHGSLIANNILRQ
jgi:hypothetical protein